MAQPNEKNLEYKKQKQDYANTYRLEHLEEIKLKKQEEYTCECSCVIAKDNKARHLQSPKHKKYLDKLTLNNNPNPEPDPNKVSLPKKKQTFICECSCIVTFACKAKHMRTTKHINYLESINNNLT